MEESKTIKRIKIKKISVVENDDVYDLNVRDNHNFFANGILVHNCGEQMLPFGSVCNLASINLVKFINKLKKGFDLIEVAKCTRILVRFLDNINDLTTAPLPEYIESIRNRRRIGIGIMGWGSALYLLKIRFGSDAAEKIKEELMRTITHAAIEASIELAEERGMFKDCEPEKHAKSEYFKQINLPQSLISRIQKSGIRNSAIFSIQPTGNTSILANIVSGGLEPVFLHEYIRTAIVPVIPESIKDLVPKYWEGEFKETKLFKFAKEGDEQILRGIDTDGTVYKIDKNRGLTKEVLCEDYAVRILKQTGEWDPTAEWAVTINDLTVDEHVKDMKGFGRWIDSSMSKTVNVKQDYKYEHFKNLYLNVYKTGYLKGITTYREGTMTAVLSSTNKNDKLSFVINKNNAPKRPKDVKSELHLFTVGKHKYYTSVGVDDEGNPYEVFTGFNEGKKDEVWTQPVKGINRKMSRGEYVFIEENTKEKFSLTNGHSDDTAAALTRMISAGLRHGVDLNFIVHQLEKTEGDMVSFSKVLARTLKKYIKNNTEVKGEECPNCNGKLVRLEGCCSCMNCSWSKCA